MKFHEVPPDASDKPANIRPTSQSGDTRRTKLRFTSRFLEKLKVDGDRRYLEIWDFGFTGASFGVRISRATRRKFFILRYQVADGRRKRLTLGEFPLISLAEAREKARSLVVDAERGSDPAREKREYLASPTFADLAEQFLNSQRLASRKERTRREYQRILELDLLPEWGPKKAVDVKKRDAAEVIDRVHGRGSEVMANRTRALISVIFNFAVEREIVEVNPVSGVRKLSPERSRDRVLLETEIGALWAALEEEGRVTARALSLSLANGPEKRGDAPSRVESDQGRDLESAC